MCDNRGLIYFLSFAIIFSCSTQKTITSKKEERGYYEDLSILRSQEKPKNFVKEEKIILSDQVKNNIKSELDSIIQIIRIPRIIEVFLDISKLKMSFIPE